MSAVFPFPVPKAEQVQQINLPLLWKTHQYLLYEMSILDLIFHASGSHAALGEVLTVHDAFMTRS